MKGIILAGGTGSRLYPITKAVSKQLLPIYNKPLIYYPLSILMLTGIKEVLIISTKRDQQSFKDLLGEGDNIGVSLSYAIQEEPKGLAEAFIIGKEFIQGDSVCLILGDNFIYGNSLQRQLITIKEEVENQNIGYVLGYNVENPINFGIAEIGKNNTVKSIEEKPLKPKSNVAVIGVYFYPNDVIEKAKMVSPSERGELEITTINNFYLDEKRLKLKKLNRGYVWFDTGNAEDLSKASEFVKLIEQKSNLGIAYLEEISIRMNFKTPIEILNNIANEKSNYYEYLKKLIAEEYLPTPKRLL